MFHQPDDRALMLIRRRAVLPPRNFADAEQPGFSFIVPGGMENDEGGMVRHKLKRPIASLLSEGQSLPGRRFDPSGSR